MKKTTQNKATHPTAKSSFIIFLKNLAKDFCNFISEVKAYFISPKFKADFKRVLKPFIILFLIYIVAISALLRANVKYFDDMGRTRYGYSDYYHPNSRLLSEEASALLTTDKYLSDMSPYTQILAAFIMAIASTIVVYCFTRKQEKIRLWNILAVIPLALSPYFLECFSYKFDSPYMAISVLASVLPILLINRKKKLAYYISIFVCAIAMLTSYQASSGIFPILVIFYLFMEWNRGENTKKLLKILLFSAISYVIGLIIFKQFIMVSFDSGHGQTTIFTIDKLIPGIIGNLTTYFTTAFTDLRMNKLNYVIGFISALFIIYSTIYSKQNKVISAFIAIILIMVSACLSFGIYPALTEIITFPRGMLGFGAFIAILSVAASTYKFSAPQVAFSIYMSYALFAFAIIYGNMMYEQKTYAHFRMDFTASDLAQLNISKDVTTEKNLEITGGIGYTPVMQNMNKNNDNNVSKKYYLLTRLVQIYFDSGWDWNTYYFRHYYNLYGYEQTDNLDKNDMRLVSDNMYESIYVKDNNVLIDLKNL